MFEDISDHYMPLPEAADRYHLTYQQLHKLIKYGHVQRIYQGRYVWVSIASLEDWLPPPGWAWLHEAAQEFSISYARVRALVKSNQVRARKRGMRWQVDCHDLAAALAQREIPPGWLTARAAGERLGVSPSDVVARIVAGYLPGRKHNGQWIVEEAAVAAQTPAPGWITTREAAAMTRMDPDTIIQWIQQERIRGQKLGGRWFVEEASLGDCVIPPGWVRATAAAAQWGVPAGRVRHWARKGKVRSMKVGRTLWIWSDSLAALVSDQD